MMNAARLELFALDPTTTPADVDRIVDRARRERFAGVVVPPAFARQAAASGVATVGVVAHPHGWEKPTIKAIAATSLAKDGVAGLLVTPLPANVVAGDVEAYRQELLEIARGARAARPTVRLVARVDLDWAATLDLPGIGAATIRGAFDGVALASADLDRLVAGVATLRATDGLDVAAIAPNASWAERLLAAGATRVGFTASS